MAWAQYGHSMGASVSGAYWAQHVLGTSNASHRMLAGGSRLCFLVGVLAQTGDGIAQSPPSTPRIACSSFSYAYLMHLPTFVLATSCTYLPTNLLPSAILLGVFPFTFLEAPCAPTNLTTYSNACAASSRTGPVHNLFHDH